MYKNGIAAILILLILVWHIYTLLGYPMYFPDDGMTASRIQAFLKTGSFNSSLEKVANNQIPNVEKILGEPNYYVSLLYPSISGVVDLFSIRAINILFIFLTLLFTFLICKELQNARLGLIALSLLGFSKVFAYSSHISRPDLFATAFGLIALYLFLFNKQNKIRFDILSASFIALAFFMHGRGCIYFPILGCMYIERYRSKVFVSKNSWSFVFAALISGLAYYFIRYLPNKFEFAEMARMTVGDSRSMPLLSLDYLQFYECLKEIFLLLKKEDIVFLALFVELFLAIIFRKNLKLAVLLFSTLFFTAGIMRNFYDFNSIIVLPIFVIGTAAFLSRFFENKILKYVALYLVITTSLSAIEDIDKVSNNICNSELEKNAADIAKIVTKDNTIIGVDAFWFFFQENDYSSWTVLNFLKRYNNWSLEQAFKYIKPEYMLADGRFFYFVKKEESDSDWFNNFLIKRQEFDPIIKKYATIAYKKDRTCIGPLILYKFNWQE